MIKIFKTKVNDGHIYAGDDYVEGRISGILTGLQDAIDSIDGRRQGDAAMFWTDGEIDVNCSAECYESFVRIVEREYPGLCSFYCE